MKINIATENFLFYLKEKTKGDIFGGGEILLLEICRILVADGHDVTVIQLGTETRSFCYEGIKVKQVKAPALRWLQRAGLIRRWFWAGMVVWKHLDKDADWVHFHYHYLAFPFGRMLRCRKTGMNHGVDWNVPWVYEEKSIKHLRDRFSFSLLKLVTRFTVACLDQIITNDYFFVHYTTHRRPNLLRKFAYIPNFAFDLFSTETKPLPGFRERFPGSTLILLPKMAMRDRGTDIMFHCLKRIKRPDLRLIVTGTSSNVPEFVQMAADLGISGQVYFTGHVDFRTELPGIYAAADVVVIPSPCREATAIAMLEGMAVGKPTIVANIGGLTEVAKDGYNSLVCPATVSAFSQAIETLLADQKLSKRLGANAAAFIAQGFNKKIWDARIRDFFRLDRKLQGSGRLE